MRRFAFLIALLATPLLHAATFRFDPPAPANTTPVAMTFSGQWPDGCPAGTGTVARVGQQITVTFPRSEAVCPAVITPFSVTVGLGVLPAGVYDVIVRRSDDSPTSQLASTKLVVRDVTTFTITPIAGPITGGTLLRISKATPFDVEPLHVSIGGVEVPVVRRVGTNAIEVMTVAHDAGPVEVRVESVMGGSFVAPAAFTFYDPNAATPDPFVFTQLLFPIDFAGPGAFGAQWITDNYLEDDNGKTKLTVTGSASGRVVPVLRTSTVFANSRIRDLSRSAQTAGTEIPVVRENDFRDRVRLLNVPTGANLRGLLRVWTTGEPANSFFLSADQVPTFAPINPPLAPVQGGLRYGTYDFSGFLGTSIDHLDLSIGVPNGTRVWAMVSITNNDTQQVTVISPQ